MIQYSSGSLFSGQHEALINPVNLVGVMGAGLALKFKSKFPNMFKAYKVLCSKKTLKIGNVGVYTLTEPKDGLKYILLFPTKEHWKSKSTTYIIESSLKALLEVIQLYKLTDIAIPKVGCGLGGLDFEFEVKPLLEAYLSDLPNTKITVYV